MVKRARGVALLMATSLLCACGNAPRVEQNAATAGGEETFAPRVPRYDVRESVYDHDETVRRLFRAIDRRDLTVFAVIDHQAGARGAGLEMQPASTIIFGAPQAGTPLMKRVPELAAELPLRAAVYNEEGTTFVAVTSLRALVRAYPALREDEERIAGLRGNIEALVEEATEPHRQER